MEDIEELLTRLVAADREYRTAIKDAQARGGKLVRRVRERLGLSQLEFAEKLGVHHTYISKIENGRTAPGKPVLRHIAQLMTGEDIEDERALSVAAA